ncbi:class D sortase [Paenibacillus jiagnxiensis]|uniref:class D sortase n=1 Tax=Paenibacillus jiagnxiensis TaxID=3228926 RepID=UPI0033B2EB03
MRKVAGILLSVAGAGLLAVGAMQYFQHQANLKEAMAEANALVGQPDMSVAEETRLTKISSPTPLIDRSEFKPKQNDVIGLLEIPKLNEDLPIIEGTDEEMLERGVGHYSTTVFPSDNEQILLSGHRDTVFRNFGKLAIGDRFIVKLPYGTYEYEIKSTDIVDKDDTSVIRKMGKEVLVVSTCYPFHYVGSAPERYILYAYPVDHVNS